MCVVEVAERGTGILDPERVREGRREGEGRGERGGGRGEGGEGRAVTFPKRNELPRASMYIYTCNS